MKPFTKVEGQAIVLARRDVDTDLIIPAQYLTSISKDGYGENLFRRLRDEDPNFVFNSPAARTAGILIADVNFGCGSSREHAVWALQGWGINVVIAKSFADIFRSNAGKNGLLTIELEPNEVDELIALLSKEDNSVTVDLATQTVMLGDKSYKFSISPFLKHCLERGMDDIEYMLAVRKEVELFRSKQPRFFAVPKILSATGQSKVAK